MMHAMPVVAILLLSLLAGCAGVPSLAPSAPLQPVASPTSAAAPPSSAPAAPPRPAAAAAPPQAAAPPEVPSPSPSIAKAAPPTAPTPPKAPPPSASIPKADTPAPEVAKPKAPPLDLTSLEQRLKSTNAIGVLTKLTLKNQVDDLLDQFRAYYQGKLKTTLADLRRSYDLLVQKVLALLQDRDPPLATAIVASRDAIWGILSDPKKFATI
jgi:hypothetical protein